MEDGIWKMEEAIGKRWQCSLKLAAWNLQLETCRK